MLNVNRKVITFMPSSTEGSLESFIRTHILSRKELTLIALHVARGMEYLEGKGCIHRLKKLFCFHVFSFLKFILYRSILAEFEVCRSL